MMTLTTAACCPCLTRRLTFAVSPRCAVERVLDGVEESRLAGAVLPGDESQRPVVKLNLTIRMAQEILDIN
jgi:hypothetical protein